MSLEQRVDDLMEENNILRTYIAEQELAREAWTQENLQALNRKLDEYINTFRGTEVGGRGIMPPLASAAASASVSTGETEQQLRRKVQELHRTLAQVRAVQSEMPTQEQLQRLQDASETSVYRENAMLKAELRDLRRCLQAEGLISTGSMI
ncbi:hypothetical protein GMRT_10575 [Giardia muris]|uniref:Coiled-coil protein n=1 Tax=Giardia muris TaxID=5742 RepID=A0A4Z1SMD6_GIAMU|nr:hypothetical protein GMRT_10575 [Giardia muris]|eukprot:TNJ26846.1 hypothetical protein GMRT_10575 [Giardia muris]